ncbi:MAG: hypothetical protein ACRD1L_05325 [Terriglobales bacterium]
MPPRSARTRSELERRLAEEREAAANAAEMVRRRVWRGLSELAPRRQLELHSGAALATAGTLAFMAGTAAGWVLRRIIRARR